jgi:hypothetical protein
MDLLLVLLFLVLILLIIFVDYWDSKGLPLPIKGVNFVIFTVVETFLRKILFIAIHFYRFMRRYRLLFNIVKKVVVGQRSVVK